MPKLLMISGDKSLAEGKRGAFYSTLEGFHKYWDRIDVICPRIAVSNLQAASFFGNVFVHPSPWPLMLQSFWILKKGKQIYREQKFDLITVHEYPPFYNGIGARLLWGKIRVPYVLEIHHIPGLPRAADFKERFYKNLARFFIRTDFAKAAAVRVVNRKQVPEFLTKSGVPRDKIIYVPSFYVDLDIFRPLAGLEKKYDLVFAGRLEKNKGIPRLLEAIRNVKLQMPNVKLLIIGSGPESDTLKLKTRNYKLEANVIFSGWLKTPDDVAEAFNEAKIFINPSFNEGGPRVALEAMACGLPIITTRVGAMIDVIKDSENGVFTDWEPEEMAEKIMRLLRRPEIQNKFSNEGLRVSQQFEKNMAIENYAKGLLKFI